jgi:hypothetical protein
MLSQREAFSLDTELLLIITTEIKLTIEVILDIKA